MAEPIKNVTAAHHFVAGQCFELSGTARASFLVDDITGDGRGAKRSVNVQHSRLSGEEINPLFEPRHCALAICFVCVKALL